MSGEINNCTNYLRRYRLLFGYSQAEIAKKLGIRSTSMISRWESGTAFPDLKNLLKLSCIYKTLVDQLYVDLRNSVRHEIHLKDIPKLNNIDPP